MQFNQAHRITLTNNSDSIVVYPAIESLEYSWEKNDDLNAKRKILDSSMMFINNVEQGSYAYDWLKEIEDQCDVCSEVEIHIEKWIEDAYYTTFQGRVKLKDGQWEEEDKAYADLNIEPNDPFSCFTDNWDDEKDYLTIEQTVTLKTIQGEVICQVVTGYDSIPDPPTGYGWTLTHVEKIEEYEQQGGNDYLNFILYNARYCREIYTNGVPTGTGWEEENGDYYRPLAVGPATTTSSTSGGQQGSIYIVIKTTHTDYPIIDIEIDNARRFSDFLEFYFSDCTIKSDFFGINPDGTAPSNSQYDYATAYLQNMVVFQASDIIISGEGEQNATFDHAKAKDIWEDLRDFFDLKIVDSQQGFIRIEHSTYKPSNSVLDLSEERYHGHLEGTKGYRNNQEDYPKKEVWKHKFETTNRDFTESVIKYNRSCANDGEDEYNMKVFATDFSFLYKNSEIENDRDYLNSVVLLSLDENDNIHAIPGRYDSSPLLNGPLAVTNLVENLLNHNRPFKSGEINGQNKTFLSTKANRVQNPITIPFSSKDFHLNFHGDMDIKAQYGVNEIESVRFNDFGNEMGILVIELRHSCRLS